MHFNPHLIIYHQSRSNCFPEVLMRLFNLHLLRKKLVRIRIMMKGTLEIKVVGKSIGVQTHKNEEALTRNWVIHII